MQILTVHSLPLSADVKLPTCFLPFKATILLGLPWTVVMPVSSTLKIRVEPKCIFSWIFSKSPKKSPTFTRLKPRARAAEVASGVLTDKFGWRRIKPLTQSYPANSLSLSNTLGMPFCSAIWYTRHMSQIHQRQPKIQFLHPQNVAHQICFHGI